MKYALTFSAGVVVGIVCLYAWQGYQFQRITMTDPISEYSVDDGFNSIETPIFQNSFSYALHRQSFKVVYGKPLRVALVGSDEVFTLTLIRIANGNIIYTWSPLESSQIGGEGELFEKYVKVAKTPSGTHIKDDGSSLRIVIDHISLEWSKGSDSGGYIYYNPSKVTLAYQKNG